MNDETNAGVHWSFWVIGVFALLWNVLGSVNFFMQLNADVVADFPETHRAIIEGRPVWATAAFGLGVIVGSIGTLLLLLRKSAANQLFIVSLIGVSVTMIHTIGVAGSRDDFGAFEILVMILMPVIVAAFLIWYAKRAESKAWLG
jgi:hypothetical protein